MAIGDPYVTLADLKDYLSIPTTKTSLDARLTDAIASASLEIERHCNRQFNLATSATSRVYRPYGKTYWELRSIEVDDFANTTGFILQTDPATDGSFSSTWTAADYELYPLNGIVDGQSGWPYDRIQAVGGLWFPVFLLRRKATVRVTAQWGWSAVPAPIRQACMIMAAETFKLKDAPFGVAGMDQFGTIRVRDNQMAASKLARYVRHRVQVG